MTILSLVKKIGYAFLWIWVISLLAFWLSKLVPGDEVLDFLSIEQHAYNASINPDQQRQAYIRVAHKRGLDLPLFYFSLRKGMYPDSLFHVYPLEDRKALRQWIQTSRDRQKALALFTASRQALAYSCKKENLAPLYATCCNRLHALLVETDVTSVQTGIGSLLHYTQQDSVQDASLIQALEVIQNLSNELAEPKALTLATVLPVLQWHGTNNQYHQWVTGFLQLKPLASLIDGRNAWTKIFEALTWTLILNGLALVLAIILGIYLGIWSGLRAGHWPERMLSMILFGLFAVPAFWLATLMIYFFSSGEWLSIFPSGGLGAYQTAGSVVEKWSILTAHLFLPVLCLTLGALAYVSRQMKQSVQHELQQPYVQALRTHGVSEKTIIRKHVVRNALFPIITLLGKALPEIISGSLIVEVIFSVPGMGRLLYTSLLSRDWPVVFPILMLGAVITVLSYMITDIVYKWLDPRVKTLT